jgi:hypothetical protein
MDLHLQNGFESKNLVSVVADLLFLTKWNAVCDCWFWNFLKGTINDYFFIYFINKDKKKNTEENDI